MKRHRMPAAVAALLGGAGLLLGACGRGAESAQPGSFPPVEVTVETVAPRTVALPYEFTGSLEGSREVEVRARVAGILLRRTFDEGSRVQKGQLLFVIDPAPYRAEVQAAAAYLEEVRAGLSRAERETARLAPLLAERAASRKDHDEALSDAEQARAALQSAQARLDQANLELSYTRVEAPIAGLTSRAERSEGSLVGPGEDGLLTRISQVKPIWVRFSVPDQTRLALQRGLSDKRVFAPPMNQLEVELVLPDDTVHPERGRVNFSDSLIDSATGSVEFRAELPNAAGALIPGQFLRVRLLGVERPDAILVPQRAVQHGQQGKFVFVVGSESQAQARPVEVGDWLGPDWIIESGLVAGERVIVDGVVKVQPGAAVKIIEPERAVPAVSPAAAAAAG